MWIHFRASLVAECYKHIDSGLQKQVRKNNYSTAAGLQMNPIKCIECLSQVGCKNNLFIHRPNVQISPATRVIILGGEWSSSTSHLHIILAGDCPSGHLGMLCPVKKQGEKDHNISKWKKKKSLSVKTKVTPVCFNSFSIQLVLSFISPSGQRLLFMSKETPECKGDLSN